MSVSGTVDQRIGAVASRQRGLISRPQLRAVGLTNGKIHRRSVNGQLARIHRGVYAVGHHGPAPLAPETAALLACGDGAALSHRTAALLWKIIPQNWEDGVIHLSVAGRHGAQPDGAEVHRTRSLPAQEIRVLEGLPLTSPARTLVDLSGILEHRGLERAVDEALLKRLVSVDRLLETIGRRHQTAALATALERHRSPRLTRSEAERRFWELMRDAELPLPQANVRLCGYEVDFYWPAYGLVVEIDGYRYHSSRPAFERDSAKGAALVAAGLVVMRFTWLQIVEQPMAVVSRVAQALRAADRNRLPGALGAGP